MSRINEEQWGEFLAELNARNAAVQPPAPPQEPELRRCGYCRAWRDKPCGLDCVWGPECPTLAEETLEARASAPPAVWQDKTADELRRIAAHIRTPGTVWAEDAIDEIARLLENRARQLSPLPSPPTPGGK